MCKILPVMFSNIIPMCLCSQDSSQISNLNYFQMISWMGISPSLPLLCFCPGLFFFYHSEKLHQALCNKVQSLWTVHLYK